MIRKLLLLSLVFLFLFGCINETIDEKKPVYKPSVDDSEQYYPVETENYSSITGINLKPPKTDFEMSFVDVGFGDATIIIADGMVVLFDAGPDPSAKKIIKLLKEKGVKKIDLFILSSNDKYSITGAPEILRTFAVNEIWVNGIDYSDAIYNVILDLAKTSKVRNVSYRDKKELKKLAITVLNPKDQSGDDKLNAQIALKFQYEDFCSILFSTSTSNGEDSYGSVSGGVERSILLGDVSVQCPVLKVSKRGTSTATSFMLLDRVKPELAVVSVGPNDNSADYPSSVTLRRLMLRNVDVYITEKLGTVVIGSFGQGYILNTEYKVDKKYNKLMQDINSGKIDYYR